MIAEVIVDISSKQVNRSFDYIIPSELEGIIAVGYRVRVPFGRLQRLGFIVKIKEKSDYLVKLKEISEVIDVYPVLSNEFIEIGKYIAENNFSFYSTAYQTMIPTALKIKYQKVARVLNKDKISSECLSLFKKDEIKLNSVPTDKMHLIYEEVKKYNVVLDTIIHKKKDSNLISFVKIKDSLVKPSSKKGEQLLDYLLELDDEIELSILIDDCGFSKGVIETLCKLGAIEIFTKEIIPHNDNKNVIDSKNVMLNESQKEAYDSIVMNKSDTYLLHGVTGSGKTEIYMRLIEDVLKSNKTAIMLVPEISLTPQITGLFLARFSSNVAILHSRLTQVEKYNEWKKIYNKDVRIVIGARSAIFAPLDNLGIIIIDECHESSYVQQNNPKYNALEIAHLRSINHNCPLILGSATPNVIDYYKATNGEYKLLELPFRANGKPLPKSIVVDLKEELKNGNRSVFSKKLQTMLNETYSRGEQSILFLNRRGFASFVMCRSCGSVVKCPHCDISLTYHASTQTLKCHYCCYTQSNVSRCYNCGSDKIRFVGSGTEKIYDEAKRLLPDAKILRMDMDTTSKISDYEELFYKFKNHEADVLIGTQMVTKGLDFENVTLVGVLNADLALSYPTYDASMVAYNLIEQVSGRAGRKDKDGTVIIQTYNPDNYVIICAKNHDYDSFYKHEIQNRKLTMMPPFSMLVEIVVSSKNKALAKREAIHIVEDLKIHSNSIILGPAEAMIFKKNDIYSYTIQIQATDDEVLKRIREIYPMYQTNKDINLSITRT